VDDVGVAKLQNKTSLTYLNLDNLPGVTDQSLPTILSLHELEFLHVGKTKLTPEGVQQISGLQKLKTLIATHLGLDEMAAMKLKSQLPRIERLDWQDAASE
jgi:hypothetical protein